MVECCFCLKNADFENPLKRAEKLDSIGDDKKERTGKVCPFSDISLRGVDL